MPLSATCGTFRPGRSTVDGRPWYDGFWLPAILRELSTCLTWTELPGLMWYPKARRIWLPNAVRMLCLSLRYLSGQAGLLLAIWWTCRLPLRDAYIPSMLAMDQPDRCERAWTARSLSRIWSMAPGYDDESSPSGMLCRPWPRPERLLRCHATRTCSSWSLPWLWFLDAIAHAPNQKLRAALPLAPVALERPWLHRIAAFAGRWVLRFPPISMPWPTSCRPSSRDPASVVLPFC